MHNILAPTYENMKRAADLLCSNELVAFPTETVYGLGGNAYSDKAVATIFMYKNRPTLNPLSVCYPNMECASRDLLITETARILAEKFLPGSVTILLKKKENSQLSLLCSAGMDTVGLRIPLNSVALELLSLVHFPLAAPSANKSEKFSPTNAKAVSDSLQECNPLTILDGGRCKLGIETTIVDCSRDVASILRLGAISKSEIEEKCRIKIVLNNEANYHDLSSNHSLNKKIVINATTANDRDALLAIGVPFKNNCKHILNLSPSGDLSEAAANFFTMINELNNTNAAKICVMPIPNIGIGVAINDRLRRYCRV